MNNDLNNIIAQFSKTDKTAIIHNDIQLSYSELNEIIIKNSMYFEEQIGIRSNRCVLLLLPRCMEQLELMATFFSIHVPYCNMNYGESNARAINILDNLKPAFIVTTQEKFESLNTNDYSLKGMYKEYCFYQRNDDSERIFDDDIAYILYTSGTTGVPKGVVISSEAAYNFIHSLKDIICSNGDLKIMCNTSFNFDISFLESIATLYYGLTIQFLDLKEQNNPKIIRNMIEKNKVDIVQMTPTLLSNLYVYFRGKCNFLNNLEMLLVGGEKFPSKLVPVLQTMTDLTVYNMYGPTEATVWATFKKVETEPVSIGKALPGYNVFVVDDDNNIIKNEIGEICISGKSVANGYLNDIELTQKRFCKDVSGYSDIMYKTGDLGIQDDDGEIICLGRKDTQIKFRGYRMELEEIETVVKRKKDIQEAIVVLKKDAKNQDILVCYYMSSSDHDNREMNAFLLDYIPNYMIPKNFIRVNEFPVKSNGKIDRSTLTNM